RRIHPGTAPDTRRPGPVRGRGRPRTAGPRQLPHRIPRSDPARPPRPAPPARTADPEGERMTSLARPADYRPPSLESPLQQEWQAWHTAREEQLSTPHGWLSLTVLHWLDGTARAFDGLPGTWRATGDGGVELTADGEALLDGTP